MARQETRHMLGKNGEKSPNARRRNGGVNNKSWSKYGHRRRSNGKNARGNVARSRRSAIAAGGNSGGAKTARRKSQQRLRPIRPPSTNSIHKCWKRELGGLIRWYANRNEPVFVADKEGRQGGGGGGSTKAALEAAEEDIERMYRESGCTIDGTRDAILRALSGGVRLEERNDGGNICAGSEWIDLSMVVETQEDCGGKPSDASQGNDSATYSFNEKGTKLAVEQRPGEGPAFAHETWTNVIVPRWAVGKSYCFEVTNRSPVDLSCEMTIDGHKVAKNAPIPANSTRTIRPDSARYFESHKWVFQPSRCVKLQQHPVPTPRPTEQQQGQLGSGRCARQAGQRYNGKYPNYHGQRVDFKAYPDAVNFGWTFTGSCEASRVEFFQKRLSMGLVLMDFYYTTGTVKTVLDHPTTGRNPLFRTPSEAGEDASDVYKKILTNPRGHTGIGYRKRSCVQTRDRSAGGSDSTITFPVSLMAVDGREANTATADATDGCTAEEGEDDETMEDHSMPVFFAKDPEYDFRSGGHVNREAAMAKLQPTCEFRAWEEAARKEWACVHARFFVSQAKKRGGWRRPPRRGARGDRSDGEALPEMAPVIDVKAAERAVLSTKFHATGPAQPRRASNIRMERISLNDSPEWGSSPVFECKLYYRADNNAISPKDGTVCSEMGEFEDGVPDDMDDLDAVLLSEQLRPATSINEYKAEKLGQLNRWHSEHAHKEEAEARLSSATKDIEDAESILSVDEAVKVYWDWNQKQSWLATDARRKRLH